MLKITKKMQEDMDEQEKFANRYAIAWIVVTVVIAFLELSGITGQYS